MIKAIFFDMDGVIIDSELYYLDQKIKAFKEINMTLTDDQKKVFLGRPFKIVLKEMFPNGEVDIEHLFDRHIELMFQNLHEMKPIQSVINFIKKNKDNYLFGLVTSNLPETVNEILKNLEIDNHFSFTITEDDVTTVKPDPEPYLKALEKSGVKAEEAIVVEDSPSGIASAKAAGLKCIALTTTFPKEELSEADIIQEELKL